MIINDDHVDVIIIHTCRRMKYCEHVVYRRPSIEKKFYKLNTTYPKEKGKVTPRSSYAARLSLVAGAVSRAATRRKRKSDGALVLHNPSLSL